MPARIRTDVTLPTFEPENRAATKYGPLIAGIDEVGRGPWAGPVIAAAAILHRDFPRELANQLDDSKRLAVKKREELADALIDHAWLGFGAASVNEIDTMNVLAASHLAMQRAASNLPVQPDACLVDGNRLPLFSCPGEALVKGDALSVSIAAASIVAKVLRDRLMARLAVRYPIYGWERNAGYGTQQHRLGIQQAGLTPHHRRSFKPIKNALSQQDS